MAVAKRFHRNIWLARLLAGLFVVGVAQAQSPPKPPKPPPRPAVAAPKPKPAAAKPATPLVSMQKACELIGGRLQSVGVETCLKAGLRPSGGQSVNGLPILWRDFAPTTRKNTPRRILLIGGIHGDELSSVSTVFQWMKELEAKQDQPFHWRVAPCVNPDGMLIRPPTRVNARGVDLNRNFMTPDWKSDSLAYWENRTRKDPRRYPGPSPLSEPESRWLDEAIKSFRPDAIVSVHAPYGLLDYDGPAQAPENFGYLHLHQLGTYPGSLGNYAGVYLGMPVITLELPHAGIMPSSAQSQRIWNDMLQWLEKNLPKTEPALYQRLEDQPWNGGNESR